MQVKNDTAPARRLSPLRRRNRQALLHAAQAILDEGRTPTLTEAADRAEVSRATAYRYFSSSEQLQNEAALDAIAANIPDALAHSTKTWSDARKKVEELVMRVEAMVRENEVAFRAMLRLSLEPTGGSRGGRRIGWIEACLDGVDMPEANRPHLTRALALLCGIEARIVLKDVCGLNDEEARETLAWAAKTLVAKAMEGEGTR